MIVFLGMSQPIISNRVLVEVLGERGLAEVRERSPTAPLTTSAGLLFLSPHSPLHLGSGTSLVSFLLHPTIPQQSTALLAHLIAFHFSTSRVSEVQDHGYCL